MMPSSDSLLGRLPARYRRRPRNARRTDQLAAALAPLSRLLQARLALAQAAAREDPRRRRTAGRTRRRSGYRSCRRISPPAAPRNPARRCRSSATISPSISASGSDFASLRDGAELFGPVQPLARVQRDLAVLDPQLHAVAVELDLVAPAVANWAAARPRRKAAARRNRASRRPSSACGLAGARVLVAGAARNATSCLWPAPRPPRRGWNARPRRLWSLPLASMNGFGALPLPCAISAIDRPEATERSSSRMSLASPSLANSSRCLIRSQLVRLPP